MAEKGNIKKIKLSNGDVYSIFDNSALRLNEKGILVTGNTVVDQVILNGNLRIAEVDDIPVADSIDNVMVAYNVGTSEEPVYQVKKRTTDKLLEDIGGISYSMDASTGTLSLKFGRQAE